MSDPRGVIDGFTLGGNKVSFGDDPDVRGRLGLRVGTSVQAWAGATMEELHPQGRPARRMGRGVSRYELRPNTSVFAKVEVTFGENIDGIGGKAGMRIAW